MRIMKRFKDIIEEGKTFDRVFKQVSHLVKHDNPNADEKLLARKTLNKLKEKRNKLKGAKRSEYDEGLTKAEEAYNKKYNN